MQDQQTAPEDEKFHWYLCAAEVSFLEKKLIEGQEEPLTLERRRTVNVMTSSPVKKVTFNGLEVMQKGAKEEASQKFNVHPENITHVCLVHTMYMGFMSQKELIET